MSTYVKHIRLLASIIGPVLMVALVGGCGDIFSRDDFVSMVKDKTSDEVAGKLGKPAATDERNPSHITWTYRHVTFQAGAASKRDGDTTVIFEREPGGKLRVSAVRFQ